MALYGLTGVHINQRGRVVRARMQRADGATNTWLGQPGEFEAHEIANLIATGDEVYGVFIVPGGTALGPKFHSVVFEHGTEGIEIEQDVEGRRIQDLILF
jgi:hypothetical protein